AKDRYAVRDCPASSCPTGSSRKGEPAWAWPLRILPAAFLHCTPLGRPSSTRYSGPSITALLLLTSNSVCCKPCRPRLTINSSTRPVRAVGGSRTDSDSAGVGGGGGGGTNGGRLTTSGVSAEMLVAKEASPW